MEIFFVGLIVVALMVYASTKIKRSAAAAFEAETIEAETFRLTKPAGYIHPLRDDSEFAFEAHTKEFGDEETKNYRRSRATLRVFFEANFETVCRDAKRTADKIVAKSYDEEAPAGQKIFRLETEKSENGAALFTFWKIVEHRARRKVYQFQVSVLEEYRADFEAAARELVESFEVK